ncbi:hypothetical protein [Bacteriovorax sp. BSW11_IV]|uniref:hypothetical protein n=1 Tax=Bacteriovorax sp. BSW11_IV TaxID=1353529 RepID=UPI00054D3BBE|nr:hypothetical protein [Bacteriovorax sp. BSW11_IV]
MSKLKFVLFFLLMSQFYGCAELLAQRSYIDEMDRETDGLFVAGRDFPVTPGDTGQAYRSREEILDRTPASAAESEQNEYDESIRNELARKLRGLSEGEYADFKKVSDYFENDSERIYYLQLSSYEKREYLYQKGVMGRDYAQTRGVQFLRSQSVRNNEIFMGMSKDQVVGAWGRPTRIDVAGNPRNQNERWAFYNNGKLQYVYFESGVVQGWALE